MTHFLILDDHAMVREGLLSFLKMNLEETIFHEASTLQEARDVLSSHPIDFALLDYKVEDEHSISLIPDIAHYHPHVKMLVFSMLEGREIGTVCIKAGAHGFLSKASPPNEILDAIKTIQGGRLYASIEISNALMGVMQKADKLNISSALTKRELQVFSLIGEGLKVSDIAHKLGISVRTIEAHRDHIKNKLDLHNAAQVVIRAADWLKEQHS